MLRTGRHPSPSPVQITTPTHPKHCLARSILPRERVRSVTQSRHEARGGLSTTLLQGGGPSVGDLTILSRYYARDAHGTDKLAINKDRHATVIRDCPT